MRIIELNQISLDDYMFDDYIETQTEELIEIRKTFDVSGMNCVMILNNFGISATLTINDSTNSSLHTDIWDGVIHKDTDDVVHRDVDVSGISSQTISLLNDSIKDWWDYWFAKSRVGRDSIFYFPTQPIDSTATIVISYPSGTAKCGMCVTGLAKECGLTSQDVKIGISDYSIIDTNSFGQTYLNVGRWAKRTQASLFMYNDNIDIHYRDVVKNRGIATGYDFNNYEESLNEYHTSEDKMSCLIHYGFTEDFKIIIKSAYNSTASIEVQGLT